MIGRVLSFWQIVREVDLGGLQHDFERPVRVAVLGRGETERAVIGAALFQPAGPGASVTLADPTDGTSAWRGPWDLAVLVLPGHALPHPAERTALADLVDDGTPVAVACTEGGAGPVGLDHPPELSVALDFHDPARVRALLAPVALAAAPRNALALGRQFPALRPHLAADLIGATSRANAQFAVLSSLPASIPLVGGLTGDLADMVVLTKNQALLLYKLAGLYGRDLSSRQRIFAELLPVVGGAFFWRSAARSLVGLVPGAVSWAPKAAIAYVGTYVVGAMARYYYDTGRRPPSGLVREFQQEALARFRAVAARLPKRSAPNAEPESGPDARPGRPA